MCFFAVCKMFLQLHNGMEDRLDDAIHVLRNHAEAGFLPSSSAGIDSHLQMFSTSTGLLAGQVHTASSPFVTSAYLSSATTSIGASATFVRIFLY